MATYIVKEPVLLPEHAAERKRDDDGTIRLGDIPNAALGIGETTRCGFSRRMTSTPMPSVPRYYNRFID